MPTTTTTTTTSTTTSTTSTTTTTTTTTTTSTISSSTTSTSTTTKRDLNKIFPPWIVDSTQGLRKKIPRDLWQTAPGAPHLSHRLKDVTASWTDMHKGLHWNLLDDDGMKETVENVSALLGPSPPVACPQGNLSISLAQAFDSFPIPVMKADLWRYAVLWLHGGIYADIDVYANMDLYSWIDSHPNCSLILGAENDVHFCQWVIISVARHPLLRQVMEIIRDGAACGIDVKNQHFVHKHTGPAVWTRAIWDLLAPGNRQISATDLECEISHMPETEAGERGKFLGVCAWADLPATAVRNLYASQWSDRDRGERFTSWTHDGYELYKKVTRE